MNVFLLLFQITSVDNEDEQQDSPPSMRTAPDTDSGIDRGTGADSRISQHSSAGGVPGAANPKLWSSFKKHVRRFGGSTGSLSSPSPTSEEHPPKPAATTSGAGVPARAQSGSDIYSPEVARLESPREGGFGQVGGEGSGGGNGLPQSTAVLKKHIRELYAQISKAESDKQKIADEAYHRAMKIKRDGEDKLEDAKVAQDHQASLIERLRVWVKLIMLVNLTLARISSSQDKVVEYRKETETANKKVEELTRVANQAEIRFRDTNEVLRTLEDRLRITEVRA